jgi:hypothetical protein
MDYNAAGAVKRGKNAPRYSEHNAKGSAKNPFGAQIQKAELVARMKAAAEAKKAAKEDG